MKKHFLFLSLLLLTIVFFNGCHKEVSVETGGAVSQGSLQSNGTGECLPKTVAGVYEVGKAINGTTNYIDVQVTVLQAGSYVIYTDTFDNIYFRANGVFTSAGLNTVRLKGNGTPTAAGIDNFTVIYGATFCDVAVTVVPPGGGAPATFTLDGAPNTCTGAAASVAGTYAVGVALTPANTAELNVNVTKTGSYNISTTTSNGITFTSSGAFLTTGPQTIPLVASGTPINAGTTNIPVDIGTNICSFTLTVITPIVTTGDYFPLTLNSWWSYDDADGIFVNGDSLTRVNVNSGTYNGNTYSVFENRDETTPSDSSYFRKAGSDYQELTYPEIYSSIIDFDNDLFAEMPFLKEGLTNGTSWQSPEYSGPMTVPTPTGGTVTANVKLQFTYTCIDANGTFAANGNAFTKVYKIAWKSKFKLSDTAPYKDDPVTFESYYAPGVGLIYFKAIGPGGSSEINVKHWKVF